MIRKPSSSANNKSNDGVEETILSLPKDTTLFHSGLIHYQNFWYRTHLIPFIISFQKHFKARNEDIIIASQPQSGTTWLKALVFSIVNRSKYTLSSSPLVNTNPHELVPTFECDLYAKEEHPDLDSIPNPRLLATHISYESLPKSITNSNCRIVYICRNPLDTIVSSWHFASQMNSKFRLEMPIDEYVEFFLKGLSAYGPLWEHILGYWNASLENPSKVLFMKYEDLKEHPILHLKKLADFLGFPFSDEEEKDEVIDQIIKACSLRRLKDLDVNKSGKVMFMELHNETFFRKGEVGDWINHLKPHIAERVQKATHDKFSGSGLNFKMAWDGSSA